jgi:hypothetical protein
LPILIYEWNVLRDRGVRRCEIASIYETGRDQLHDHKNENDLEKSKY